MDDFVIPNLHESRNEWCTRLVSIFTPLIIEGIRSIFIESWNICIDTDETNKYLMTFQNLLMRIPKWNNHIIETEALRIIERSKCDYIEDLISCVHIIQLKVLTCIRVGSSQKKIDLAVPKLDTFVHKIYVNVARKVYSNVYLFEKNISPLLQQKNNRELELIIQDCILMTIRDSVPTEAIIRAYMDESVEHDEEVFIEDIAEEPVNEPISTSLSYNNNIPDVAQSLQTDPTNIPFETKLSFNDVDTVLDGQDNTNIVDAPKTLEQLEHISSTNAMNRSLEEISNNDYDNIRIHGEESINLTDIDVLDEPFSDVLLDTDINLDDVEELF
jgi:hypothetical protein